MAVASLGSPIGAPDALLTQVFVNGAPALTEGGVLLTVTITDAVLVHPVAVFVLVTV